MMAKVLLTNTFFQKRVEAASLMSIVPPLDIAYCASVLRQGRPDLHVSLIDANALGLDYKRHLGIISEKHPDILVFTAKTHSINTVKRMCKALKVTDDNLKIILIGTHGCALPTLTMEEIPELDFIILGEPEISIKALVDGIIEQKGFSSINGIAFRKNERIVVNKQVEVIKDLDKLPFPARDLLPNSRYWAPFSDRVTAIQATRGCPGSCSYCEVHNLYGFKIRKRGPKNIIMEMKECIKKYKTEYFAFIDHNLIADKAFIEGFCRIIIREGLHRKIFWSCNSRIDMVHKETLDLMEKAGCLQIGVGIESGDDKHLKMTGKGIRQDQIKKTVYQIKKAGIMVMGYSMIGYPADDMDDVRMTERLLIEYDPHVIQLSIVTPLPGSQLYGICMKDGLITSRNWDDYLFLNKSIIKNKNFTSNELIKERNRIILRFYLRPKKLIGLTYFILFKTKVRYRSVLKAFLKIIASIVK